MLLRNFLINIQVIISMDGTYRNYDLDFLQWYGDTTAMKNIIFEVNFFFQLPKINNM